MELSARGRDDMDEWIKMLRAAASASSTSPAKGSIAPSSSFESGWGEEDSSITSSSASTAASSSGGSVALTFDAAGVGEVVRGPGHPIRGNTRCCRPLTGVSRLRFWTTQVVLDMKTVRISGEKTALFLAKVGHASRLSWTLARGYGEFAAFHASFANTDPAKHELLSKLLPAEKDVTADPAKQKLQIVMLQTYLQEALKLCKAAEHPAIAALLSPFQHQPAAAAAAAGKQHPSPPSFERHSGWLAVRRPLSVPPHPAVLRWCALSRRRFGLYAAAGEGSECIQELGLEGGVVFTEMQVDSDPLSFEILTPAGARLGLTASDAYSKEQWVACLRRDVRLVTTHAAIDSTALSSWLSITDPIPPFARFVWVGAPTPDHTMIHGGPLRRRLSLGGPEDVEGLLPAVAGEGGDEDSGDEDSSSENGQEPLSVEEDDRVPAGVSLHRTSDAHST